MTAEDAYDALMVDHAAGALAPAQALLVDTHLGLKPAARAAAAALAATGGALLESMAPVEVAALPLAALAPALVRPPAPDRLGQVRAMVAAARRTPDALHWRWRAPGLREVRLPLEGASLIRLAGGGALAPHGHAGEEFTLVLRGQFFDAAGMYDVGDIGFADESVDHNPRVPPGDECVCLVAATGELKFHGVLARVTARLLA